MRTDKGSYAGSEMDQFLRQGQFDLLNQYRTNITQPIQPFTYNVEELTQDPRYQARLRELEQSAERNTNQALVNLGRRGIGNSQSAVTAALAQQQNVTNIANTQLLPELINQKYQEYLDQRAAQERQNQAILGLAGTLGDMNRQNWQDAFAYRQFQEGVRQADRQFGLQEQAQRARLTGTIVDENGNVVPTTAEQQRLLDNAWTTIEKIGYVPEDLAAIVGVPAGTPTLQAKTMADELRLRQSQIGLEYSREGRLARQAALDNLYRQWEMTGVAPAGIPGVAPGTPLFDPVAARQGEPEPTANDLIAAYISQLEQLTPEEIQRVFREERENIIKDIGPSGYRFLADLYLNNQNYLDELLQDRR
jgi:hypothetical protein